MRGGVSRHGRLPQVALFAIVVSVAIFFTTISVAHAQS